MDYTVARNSLLFIVLVVKKKKTVFNRYIVS